MDKLEGKVDAYGPGVTITVLGIEYGLNGNTIYSPPMPMINPDDVVEMEDDIVGGVNPPGIADEVELD